MLNVSGSFLASVWVLRESQRQECFLNPPGDAKSQSHCPHGPNGVPAGPSPSFRPPITLQGLALLELKTPQRDIRGSCRENAISFGMMGGLGVLGRVCYWSGPPGSLREADWPRLVGLARVVASAGRRQGLAHTNPSVPKGQGEEQSESRCRGLVLPGPLA